VRFGLMPIEFLQQTVRVWPPMTSTQAMGMLLDVMMLRAGGSLLERRKRSPVQISSGAPFTPT
jgi:hypothetical protein